MLRTIDEKQGIGIYTQNLMDHIIPFDDKNEYVLFYRNPEYLGRYKQYGHVKEKLVKSYNKVIWDQIKIPIEMSRERIDLLFHTKFTVPLLTRRKSVMVMHGSEWFVHPGNCGMIDRFYINIMMPMYCKKATAISSVSRFTADDIIHHIGVDSRKLYVVHSATDPHFIPVRDKDTLENCRSKFDLPERYILYIGKSYPGKNFLNVIKSLRLIKDQLEAPVKLVAAGDLEMDFEEYHDQIRSLELKDDIVPTGWVSQRDLPAIYSMAELLLFPSMYEGFGIPIVEAMACGCPVVTSETGAPPEIAGSAAMFVDPMDVGNITETVLKVIRDKDLRESMINEGFSRTKKYSWDKAARETLDIFHAIMADQ